MAFTLPRRALIALGTAALASLALQGAHAQSYPTRPVRLVVPFAPGGTTDIVARVVAERINGPLGQTMVVENKAGGGGIVGANETAKATPDGYSLGVATVSTTASNPAINPKTPYNPLTDFTPIINIAATPNVIAVHPSFPARDYKTFLEVLKKNPGKYSYATSGTGGIGHMQMELFKNLSGTFVTHIPYRGAGPALNDTVAGQVPLVILTAAAVVGQARAGKLRALAVTTLKRSPGAPDVPTVAEALGLPDYEVDSWIAMFAPSRTPAPVIARMQKEIARVVQLPEVRARLIEQTADPVASSAEELDRIVKTDLKKWAEVIPAAKIKAD